MMQDFQHLSIHTESHQEAGESKKQKGKTYSKRDSLVVTDPAINLPIRGLIQDERTDIP